MIATGDLRLKSIWSHILSVMNENEREFPAALVYSVDPTSTSSRCLLKLEGNLGIPGGHPSAPEIAELNTSNEGFVPYFRKTKVAGSAILLEKSDSSLPKELKDDLTWWAFGQPSDSAIVIPFLSAERVLGFIVTLSTQEDATMKGTVNSQKDLVDSFPRFWQQFLLMRKLKLAK